MGVGEWESSLKKEVVPAEGRRMGGQIGVILQVVIDFG